MNLKKIILLLVLVPLIALAQPLETEEVKINPRDLSTDQQVIYFSNLYGGDAEVALKVMECESGGNHQVTGDGGRSNGIFQFQRSTFNRMEKILGEDLNYDSQFDQVKLASFALSKPELAREWTAFVAIEKGGKYSFWSRQLNKHFVVYCKL